MVPTDQPERAQFMLHNYLVGSDLPDKLTQY
jgi:hypothetical protein